MNSQVGVWTASPDRPADRGDDLLCPGELLDIEIGTATITP